MKKFFSFLGILLLIAAVVATFTAPGKEKCTEYVKKHAPAGIVNLNVSEIPYKLFTAKVFSIFTVTYYKPSGLKLNQQATVPGDTIKSRAMITLKALSGYTSEKYLGLFGRFWKL